MLQGVEKWLEQVDVRGAGRPGEERAALLVVAKLAKLGYESCMCGIMAGADGFFLLINTLKFRWRDGEPLPAKLYMKAGWCRAASN